MAIHEDIIDGIEDILQSVVDSGLQKLLEVLIAGFTLVFSAPTIALATIFNDEPGFVDPLLLPPLEVVSGRLSLDNRVSHPDLECTAHDLELESEDLTFQLVVTFGAMAIMDSNDTGLAVTHGELMIYA